MRPGRAAAGFAVLLVLASCGPKTAASPSPTPSPSSSAEPLQMASVALKAGEVGLAYAGATFAATGGVQPYMFQVVEGALPAGLTLSRDGVVSGTPTTAGDFSFSVQVVDSGGQANSSQDSIDVVPALALTLKSGTIYVESGCDTVCGGFANQTGGQAPYTYSVTAGAVPAGTSLSATALAGKFSSPGTYKFTVEARDALGAASSVSPTFSVFPHIYFYCAYTYSAWTNCYPAGAAGYSGITFLCNPPADKGCGATALPFEGGSGGGWRVSYSVVSGLPNPVVTTMVVPATSGLYAYVQVGVGAPPGTGRASGALLVTLSDGAICGPGPSTYCSTTTYLTYSTPLPHP